MSRNVVRTKTRDVVLESPVLHSPVDDSSAKTRRRTFWIVVLLVAAIIAISLIRRFTTDRPVDYQAEVDHFKYGSIGAEEGSGIPYWIWRVLPIVFEDKLPKRPGVGYERIGFLSDGAPHGRPIGTSFRPGRGDRVGLNCATCHVGTIRDTRDSPRRVVLGMPANQMDLQAYARFLTACAQDPRFNAGTLIAAIRKENPDFGLFSRLFYRLFIIRATKNGILDRAKANAWFDVRPPFGPGRVDTFNPYKTLFGIGGNETTVGTVDLPPLFNQRPREGMYLHWDGNNNSVTERNISAAIGAGSSEESLDEPALQRVREWILDAKAPRFPSDRIDAAQAREGAEIYQANCASCHAFGGDRVGTVTPIAEIGTDRERLDSFTEELVRNMNTLGTGRPWRFRHFRKTDGYANQPLDGIWIRAPYLHNGSVPDLESLLAPPAERPKVFYRDYDVYDYDRVGFVTQGPEAESAGWRFDTSVRGNGNGGHEYGTDLDQGQKAALLEYLKTL
jgi:mono/diheme cytochrome c family protein